MVGRTGGPDVMAVGEFSGSTDFSNALEGIDTVVHLAAAQNDETRLDHAMRVNHDATLALARQAIQARVRRFVFVSTIKVLGEATREDRPFTSRDPAAPVGAYAISKSRAEDSLREISRETGLQLVVIRPPLVYGPGAKNSFQAMVKAVKRGLPLPLGAVKNRRSLLYVGNLVDLILHCVAVESAPGPEPLLVSDGESLSTPQMLRLIGEAVGRRPMLPAVPVALLTRVAAMLNKSELIQRLVGSLEIDDGDLRRRLPWRPPHSTWEGIQLTAGSGPRADATDL